MENESAMPEWPQELEAEKAQLVRDLEASYRTRRMLARVILAGCLIGGVLAVTFGLSMGGILRVQPDLLLGIMTGSGLMIFLVATRIGPLSERIHDLEQRKVDLAIREVTGKWDPS